MNDRDDGAVTNDRGASAVTNDCDGFGLMILIELYDGNFDLED